MSSGTSSASAQRIAERDSAISSRWRLRSGQIVGAAARERSSPAMVASRSLNAPTVAAARSGRRYVGYDTDPAYVDLARARVAREGTPDPGAG